MSLAETGDMFGLKSNIAGDILNLTIRSRLPVNRLCHEPAAKTMPQRGLALNGCAVVAALPPPGRGIA